MSWSRLAGLKLLRAAHDKAVFHQGHDTYERIPGGTLQSQAAVNAKIDALSAGSHAYSQ